MMGRTSKMNRVIFFLLAFLAGLVFASFVHAQVTPEEHAAHHPEQTQQTGSDSQGGEMSGMGGDKGGMGGMMGGGEGGGMGGMMGGMMEKMGAPKPKEMYPKLMDFPNMSAEQRAQFQQEAHARMIAGTALLSEGLDELSTSAPTDDFAAMQAATSKMREGLAQFESGLAAHRAIAEGKSPRNVATQWFKQEMNLIPPAANASTGFSLFGMGLFHSFIMAALLVFTAAMIWMYFFKMRRASALLERLVTAGGAEGISTDTSTQKSTGALSDKTSTPISGSIGNATVPTTPNPSPSGDSCCGDANAECPTEGPLEDAGISAGLLPVAKKKLCRLRVAKIIQEANDVKTFRLVACHGGGIPFSYLPGQFLTLTLPVAEKPIRRSYTISSSPTQGYYCEVTVKREEQGAGSRYLHDHIKVGDTLEVKAPSGRFTFAGEDSDSIVLISGGVGITPMMSITRALTDMCWPGEIYFVAACRDVEHFLFEAELKALQQQHENLHVFAAMSQLEDEIDGYRRGRLNKNLLAEWIPNIASKRIHICGPPGMMEATKAMLGELDVPAENIHTENFGSTQKPKAKVAEKQEVHEQIANANAANVTFATSNKSTVLQPDETILEASERIDVDIDYSCRTGTCGECAVKLLSGNVSMEVDDGLEPEQKEAGMILACQAIAKDDVSVEA